MEIQAKAITHPVIRLENSSLGILKEFCDVVDIEVEIICKESTHVGVLVVTDQRPSILGRGSIDIDVDTYSEISML